MRIWTVSAAFLLLALAWFRSDAGGQGAVSLSRSGHEDLTFWVNHNGLTEIDVEGEVGFGDLARILLRRRSNAELIRPLRDRFTFRIHDARAIETPDVFHAIIDDEGAHWKRRPEQYIATAGRIANIALILENQTQGMVPFQASLGGSRFKAELASKQAGAYFLKLTEAAPGKLERELVVSGGGRELRAKFAVDVRPLAKLKITLSEPARVYLTASDGLAWTPKGAIHRIMAMSAEPYFHAEGSFEMEAPAGRTVIEATRGPEYELVRQEVNAPGEATVRLKRWENMAERGFYSSDVHIHANYTAPHHQVVTPEDVRMYTLGEDLNNANMMVANSSNDFIHDQAFFEAKPHRLSGPAHIIYWNEEMRNAGLYGHMCLLGLKSLVHPIYSGFRDTPHWEDYPPNFAQAAETRRQGGAVSYAHPGYGATFDRASARELPVDLALGEMDAMDVLSNNFEPATSEIWYRLLNCGFRLAISAGMDSFTNVADHYAPGGGRVYVKSGSPLRYGDWITAYKRGRSFASNGPMVWLTVNGKEPGEEITLPGAAKVRVKADVRSSVPVDTLEIIVNGKPAIFRKAKSIDEELSVERGSWIAARVTGPWSRLVLDDSYAFAHTSPVYLTVGGKRALVEEDVRFFIDWIDQLSARTKERGRFATPERRDEVLRLFARAREVYSGLTGR